MDEKISVIIPAFNAQDTLVEAMNSVINGSYNNIEVLIIDDCSTDDTGKIAVQMSENDPRIYYHKNDVNQGVSKSRNLMIKLAKGRFVAFLDSDDTWEPNKLEICVETLVQNPDIKAVGHALRYLDKKGRKLSYLSAYPTTREELETINKQGILPNVFPSSVVVERETLLKEKGFAEDWEVGEDTELFSRIAQNHGLLALTEPLGNYRLQGGSLTDKHWLKKRLARECVMENVRKRNSGEKEVSLKEYEKEFIKNTPPLKKLNIFREILATRYIRKTGEAWLNDEIINTIIYAALGTALAPKEIIIRIQRWKRGTKSGN